VPLGLEDHGLHVPSGHFDYEKLESKLDYAQTLGVKYMICPMLPKKMQMSADGFKKAGDQLNHWGEMAGQRGMRFGFHNHNYEFRKFGDTTGFQTLLSATDPKLVCLELDCYWVTQAGGDPVQMLLEHRDRIHLLHLKDRKPGFSISQELNRAAEHFTEVGSGTLDWKNIFATAEKVGVEHYFVERDNGDLPPIDSLRVSFQNIQKLLA